MRSHSVRACVRGCVRRLRGHCDGALLLMKERFVINFASTSSPDVLSYLLLLPLYFIIYRYTHAIYNTLILILSLTLITNGDIYNPVFLGQMAINASLNSCMLCLLALSYISSHISLFI